MYVLLLLLGAVITAAGLALLLSGVSLQDHSFDASNLTPGATAIVGGCILIGLAFVARGLLRVERALLARSMPHPARPAEVPSSPVSPPAIPTPPKQRSSPPSPGFELPENTPVVEQSDVSLLQKKPPPARVEEDATAVNYGVAPARSNGDARARPVVRADAGARSAAKTSQFRRSVFDALWPKGQRSTTDVRSASSSAAVPPHAPAAAASGSHGSPAATAQGAPISILKSGVVEGMPYTLYSDGSIEAQLPQGTLRFGSITELRNHIDQAS